jgi:ribosomal protein L29
MSTKKLQSKTIKELEKELDDKRQALSETRFNLRIGRESDYAQVKYLKKDLARITTVLQEKIGKKKEKKTIKNIKLSKKKNGKQEKSPSTPLRASKNKTKRRKTKD